MLTSNGYVPLSKLHLKMKIDYHFIIHTTYLKNYQQHYHLKMNFTIKITCNDYNHYYKIDDIYNCYHHSYYFTLKDGYEGIYFTFPKHIVYKYLNLLTIDLINLLGEGEFTIEAEEEGEEDDGE